MLKQQRKNEIIVRININYRIIFGLAHPMIVSWAVTRGGDAFGRGSLYPSQRRCSALNCNKEAFISEMCDWAKYRHNATKSP